MIADPFASVWDEGSLAQQRRLLQRVLTIAHSRGIALYLDSGTLLGHVREARILPWDDDVDFALFDASRRAELRAAMHADGLQTIDPPGFGDTLTKICDPNYPITSEDPERRWTWPFVDVFVFEGSPTALVGSWPTMTLPREFVLPGQATTFEGAPCWEPAQPLALLDLLYPNWRTIEATSSWHHRKEYPNTQIGTRPIQTDSRGRKIHPPQSGN